MDVKKALIGIIIMGILLNLSFGSSQTNLTSDDVFTELKLNEPTGKSIITINTPEKVDISKFGLKFITRCGIVKSYTLKVKSLCEKDNPIYELVEICGETNETTGSKCHYEEKITGTAKTMETCYKYTDYIEGNQDYEIEADIISTKCDDNTYGYHIDWIPSIEIDGKEIEQPKWAVWNGTGGSITTDGLYTIHTFTSNSTFTFNGTVNATVLVVAGGGGGGTNTDGYGAGGGGAGGYLYNTSYPLSDGIYPVTVGSKGLGAVSSGNGTSGSWSSFGVMNSTGGGAGGGGYVGAGYAGKAGGSGGGGGPFGAYGGLQVVGQGYPGGRSWTVVTDSGIQGGGGGGAGNNGTDGSATLAGAGGSGLNISINGTLNNYSCGGGGSTYQNNIGAAGCPGAGSGAKSTTTTHATNATCFGCGGGAGNGGGLAGNGANGIVIIRYLTYTEPPPPTTDNTVIATKDYLYFYSKNITINSSLLPETNDTLSLGSPELQWKDVYIGTSSLWIGGQKLSNVEGTLYFDNQLIGQGTQGIPGSPGTNGTDGRNGIDGVNGRNGTDGTNGTNGNNGTMPNSTFQCTGTDKISNISINNNILNAACTTDETGGTGTTLSYWYNVSTNNYNISNTLTAQIVEGISIKLLAYNNYSVTCNFMYQAGNVTATSGRFTANLTSNPTSVYHYCESATSGTARYQTGALTQNFLCASTASIGVRIPTDMIYEARIITGINPINVTFYYVNEAIGAWNYYLKGNYCRTNKI